MKHTFNVKTTAIVEYANLVEVSDEQIDEYRANNPEYAESTNEEIVQIMFYNSEVEMIDSYPMNWRDEQIISTKKYKY